MGGVTRDENAALLVTPNASVVDAVARDPHRVAEGHVHVRNPGKGGLEFSKVEL